MFERHIADTIALFTEQTIGDGQSIFLRDVLTSPLPESIKRFYDIEAGLWVDDEKSRLLTSPHFRYDDDRVLGHFDSIIDQARQYAVFGRDEYLRTLEKTVKLLFNYVCRPQWTLIKYVYADADTMSTDMVLHAMSYFADYEYFQVVLRDYFERKSLTRLTRDRFEELLALIDNELIRNSDTRALARLTEPMFRLFSPSTDPDDARVPVEALSIFFDDKNVSAAVERLDAEKPRLPELTLHEATMLLAEVDFLVGVEISSLVTRHVSGGGTSRPAPEFAAGRDFDTASTAHDTDTSTDVDPYSAMYNDAGELRADAMLATGGMPIGADDAADGDEAFLLAEDTTLPASTAYSDEDLLRDPSLLSDEDLLRDPSLLSDEELLRNSIVIDDEDLLRDPALASDEDLLLHSSLSLGDDVDGDALPADEAAVFDGESGSHDGGLRTDAILAGDAMLLDDDDMLFVPPDSEPVTTGTFDAGALPGTTAAATPTELDDDAAIEAFFAAEGSVLSEASVDAGPAEVPVPDLTAAVHPDDTAPSLDHTGLQPDADDYLETVPAATDAPRDVDIPNFEIPDDATVIHHRDDLPYMPPRPDPVSFSTTASPQEVIARLGDLRTMIGSGDRKQYIKKMFNRDEEAYERAIDTLNGRGTWREASEYIDEVFLQFHIDMYSRIAVKFTDDVYRRYLQKKG